MALASLMAQLGPELNAFGGQYEFAPRVPPPPLTEQSQLEVLDRDTIRWTNTQRGASAVYVRSKKNPTHFVGVDGSVSSCCNAKYDNTGDTWVMDSPGKPLHFRPKTADPKSDPTHTAMLCEVPEEYENRRVAGSKKKEKPDFAALTAEGQKREQKKWEREQKEEAERMEIRERISNDRASRRATKNNLVA